MNIVDAQTLGSLAVDAQDLVSNLDCPVLGRGAVWQQISNDWKATRLGKTWQRRQELSVRCNV